MKVPRGEMKKVPGRKEVRKRSQYQTEDKKTARVQRGH